MFHQVGSWFHTRSVNVKFVLFERVEGQQHVFKFSFQFFKTQWQSFDSNVAQNIHFPGDSLQEVEKGKQLHKWLRSEFCCALCKIVRSELYTKLNFTKILQLQEKHERMRSYF